VVRQEAKSGLSAREAKRVLSELAPLLEEGVIVDLSYRIVGDD
jgi:recombinational DNA repair protein (RecF pathway)